MLSIALNEQLVMKLVIQTPELIFRFDKNYFISKIGQDFFQSLKNAFLESFDLTLENIIIFGNKINNQITKELIQTILNIEVDSSNFEKHFKQLKKDYAKNRIENKILKDTLIESSSKGELNVKKMESLRDEINECLEIVEGKESLLITPEQMFDSYKRALTQRAKGEGKYESGDSYLDSYLTMGFAPGQMTLIYGGTGEGKSIYALHLIIKQINKQIPCLYISLENDEIMTTDRIISIKTCIPYTYFLHSENGVNEDILDIVEKERNDFANNNSFFFVKEPNLSLADIEILIKEAKRKLGVNYLICTIDLLTMVREFSTDISATKIEEYVNELHRIARRQNVHIVNVVQANTSNNYKPNSVDDIYGCRPNLKNVKNSKAFGERSRIVLSIFRPKVYAETFFGKEHPEVEIMDDTLEVRIEKQSQGKRANLRYLFTGENFKLYKYVKEKQEKIAQK